MSAESFIGSHRQANSVGANDFRMQDGNIALKVWQFIVKQIEGKKRETASSITSLGSCKSAYSIVCAKDFGNCNRDWDVYIRLSSTPGREWSHKQDRGLPLSCWGWRDDVFLTNSKKCKYDRRGVEKLGQRRNSSRDEVGGIQEKSGSKESQSDFKGSSTYEVP